MDNTQKFSGRAENYTKGRPGYPSALFDCLYTDYGFSDNSSIADIGSGTGKFSKYLLDKGSTRITQLILSLQHRLFIGLTLRNLKLNVKEFLSRRA